MNNVNQHINTDASTKCQGIGCAFKHACGRFIRADVPNQQWASFYALPGDDCDYFQSAVNTEGIHVNA